MVAGLIELELEKKACAQCGETMKEVSGSSICTSCHRTEIEERDAKNKPIIEFKKALKPSEYYLG